MLLTEPVELVAPNNREDGIDTTPVSPFHAPPIVNGTVPLIINPYCYPPLTAPLPLHCNRIKKKEFSKNLKSSSETKQAWLVFDTRPHEILKVFFYGKFC
jgi:hypothetical protein